MERIKLKKLKYLSKEDILIKKVVTLLKQKKQLEKKLSNLEIKEYGN